MICAMELLYVGRMSQDLVSTVLLALCLGAVGLTGVFAYKLLSLWMRIVRTGVTQRRRKPPRF